MTKNTRNPRKYLDFLPLCYQVVLKFIHIIHKTVSLFEAISLRTGAQSRYRWLPIFPWWIDSDRYSGSSLSNIYRIRYVLQCLDRLMTSKTVESCEGVEQARQWARGGKVRSLSCARQSRVPATAFFFFTFLRTGWVTKTSQEREVTERGQAQKQWISIKKATLKSSAKVMNSIKCC